MRSEVLTTQRSHRAHTRKVMYTGYEFRGRIVCQKFFQLVNDVNINELRNMKKTLGSKGVWETMHAGVKQSSLNVSYSHLDCNMGSFFLAAYQDYDDSATYLFSRACIRNEVYIRCTQKLAPPNRNSRFLFACGIPRGTICVRILSFNDREPTYVYNVNSQR